MKKYLAFTLVALFLIINATTTFGQYNSTKLDEKINRYVSFPYLLDNHLYGKVAVMFDVNNEGRLDVTSIISDNPQLVEFVQRRLNKIILPLDDEIIGTSQNIVLNFKPEEDRL
jgi:hypothetical protein